jgi:hypothetical protein
MIKIPISAAAAGLLRALIARAGVSRDRILLSDFQSTEWQSLTLVGERHLVRFRLTGPESDAIVANLTAGIEDAEFAIPNQIVADIALAGIPQRNGDGSITVELEALTIAE